MKTQKNTPQRKKLKEVLAGVLVLLSVQVFSTEAENTYNLSVKVDSGLYYMLTSSANLENLPVQSELNYRSRLEAASRNTFEYNLAEEIEVEIALEDWMLSAKDRYWQDVYTDKEDAIKLEEWMMDASVW